ncbi:MAG: hypothetical protein HYU44_18920, partial [Betaproteobacteria bacterium]|nr:hypothetical protein [Betaproteobacteria bacterium]
DEHERQRPAAPGAGARADGDCQHDLKVVHEFEAVKTMSELTSLLR